MGDAIRWGYNYGSNINSKITKRLCFYCINDVTNSSHSEVRLFVSLFLSMLLSLYFFYSTWQNQRRPLNFVIGDKLTSRSTGPAERYLATPILI